MKIKTGSVFVLLGVFVTAGIILLGIFDSPYFYNKSEDFRLEHIEQTSDVFSDENKIDLNSADAEQLESLYGIGEARARAIIEYRYQNGGFLNVDELILIKGISEEILNRNKDIITVVPYTGENYELQSD